MIVFLLLACHSSEPAKPSSAVIPAGEDTSAPSAPTMPDVTEPEVGEGDVTPSETVYARQLKRMTIPQVRDSMVRVSGGVFWGSDDESTWDEYAETLGVADYQLRVENDRSPSVMFQKFLDDAATATCLTWIQAPDTSFFAVEDPSSLEREDILANIVGLRWQIQGKAKDSAVPIVADYEQLFVKAHQRTDSFEAAWQTVCVAMFTHPDFFMY